ncbi:MAG: PAS domain S-box protein, partial [Proteobacteria bacterium]|nr:PAS domain S-box protein [Pseudomonadota bacterium]
MKKFHLSTYLSITIAFLVICSTLVTSGILYYSLSRSLTAEFEDRVRAECGEIMQVLANQFRQTENRLKELSQDNTIRVTMMLGATQQLQEHLGKKYGLEKDTHFFLTVLNSEKIFNASGLKINIEKLRSLLASSAGIGNLEKIKGYGFIYSLSQPVFRQKNQIGTAASIYILNKDETLLKFVQQNKNSTILALKENQAWDIISEKAIKSFNTLSGKIGKGDLSYGTINGEKTVAVKKKQFPDLIYVSNLDRLDKAKNKVFTLVLYSSLAVLIFTVAISSFLSRLLGRPLSLLSKQSLEIADGKLNMERTISSNVIEVEQLVSSLSTMVNHLKKTEELKRYQQLFEGVTDPVFINEFSTNFIEVNQIALDQFGFEKEELDTMRLADMVPEKHHKRIFNVMQDLSQKGGRIVFETEILTKRNRLVYVECHAKKIVFKDQEVVLSVVRDVTDRKKTEEALIRSEERLSLALEVSLAGAWELNLKTTEFTVDVNQFKSLGYSEIEHPKKISDLLKIIDPKSIDTVKKRFNDFIHGKYPDYTDEFLVLTKTGEQRWMHNRARVIKFDKDQKPMMVIGTAIDISELKRAEQALRKNEERYRTILDNRNIGYFEIDLDGNLLFFNDALCELMGYGSDELLGLNYKVCTDKETSIEIENKYKNIFKTGRPLEKFEYVIRTKDGESRMVETSVSLIRDSSGLSIGFRGLTIDITDRKTAEQEKKKLETKLRQAHKMEAIGTLSGGIAHDFNNILSGILGYAQLAEMNIENYVKAKGCIAQIVKGAKRAAGLTQQILSFSRQAEHEKHLLNFSIVVKEAIKLLRSSIPATIEIRENIVSDATVLA